MRMRIQILLWIILITASTATVIHSQETRPINFVSDSASIQAVSNGEKRTFAPTDCEADLAAANQRLLKVLDALEQSEKALVALQAELKARENLDRINDELLKKKDQIISDQAKLIAILEKQTGRKICILTCGFIKIRL